MVSQIFNININGTRSKPFFTNDINDRNKLSNILFKTIIEGFDIDIWPSYNGIKIFDTFLY